MGNNNSTKATANAEQACKNSNNNSNNNNNNMNMHAQKSAFRTEVDSITSSSPLIDKEHYATWKVMEGISQLSLQEADDMVRGPVVMADNSGFEYNYQRLDLPKDSDGFIIAFEPHQEDDIRNFFQQYGCVVVKNVISEEDCQKSEDEIWQFLERHSFENKVKRDDPSSWEWWPSLARFGILGNDIILSPQIMQNRQNPNVHRAFAAVLDTPKLWVSVERANTMRPTRNVKMSADTEGVDKPEWKSLSEWLHWDMNPWTGKTSTYSWKSRDRHANKGYDITRIQGLLAVVDCREQDGGFHCVPGFQHHIRGWANANKKLFKDSNPDTSCQVPEEDPIRNDIQRMPIRKGSLLIWSACLPHGSFPNDSENFRMIQYLKASRIDDMALQPHFEREMLPEGFVITELGEKVLGLKEW